MRFFLCILFLVQTAQFTWAQSVNSDTLFQLEQVEISTFRKEARTIGKKIDSLKSSIHSFGRMGNIGELLESAGKGYMKQYSPGGIITSALRGTQASHTAILWNGFSLQNPLNGLVDLSLVPVGLFSDVLVESGGGSAMFGSGAIGGSIHLRNSSNLADSKFINLSLRGGSLGQQMLAVSGGTSWQRGSYSTYIWQNVASNEFKYLQNSNRLSMSHAATRHQGITQNFAFDLSDNHQLSVFFWGQEVQRQIPFSVAEQADENLRGSVNWKYATTRFQSQLKAGVFSDRIIFRDSVAQLDERNESIVYQVEGEGTLVLSPSQRLHGGINYSYITANADGFSNISQSQERQAIFASYKQELLNRRFNGFLTVRQERVDRELLPIMPSLGGAYKVNKRLVIRAQVNRSYRLPSFNDLYWNPGGNPDLLPESGWGEELGMTYLFGKDKQISFSNTFFNQQTNHLIVWVPGPTYWFPENLRKVWARGIESEIKLRSKIWNIDWRAEAGYSFTRSTNQRTTSARDASLHKQLIYIPVHSGRAALSGEYLHFKMGYIHLFTSHRFNTSDNTTWLPSYQLGQFFLSTKIKFTSRLKGALNFNVDNIWNASYESVAGRPMPLRNFSLGITLNGNWKKNKTTSQNQNSTNEI